MVYVCYESLRRIEFVLFVVKRVVRSARATVMPALFVWNYLMIKETLLERIDV